MTMKVYVHAFRLTAQKKPSVARFVELLVGTPPAEEMYNGQKRLLVVGAESSGWVRGSLFTTKPARSILRKVQTDAGTTFELEHLEKGTSSQGFNPVVYNPATRIGLIASHIGACSFGAFRNYLRHLYVRARTQERQHAPKAQQSEYGRGNLDVTALCTKQAFADHVRRMVAISEIEFDWEEVSSTDGHYQFLEPVTARRVERWSLTKGASVAGLLQPLIRFVNDFTPTDAKVSGTQDDGEDVSFRLSTVGDAAAIAHITPMELWSGVQTGCKLAQLLNLDVHSRLIDIYKANAIVQGAVKAGAP